MKIGVAADHAGFEQKQGLLKQLQEAGYDVKDYGALEYNALDDYPDIIVPLAKAVQSGEVERGIVRAFDRQRVLDVGERVRLGREETNGVERNSRSISNFLSKGVLQEARRVSNSQGLICLHRLPLAGSRTA